MTTDNEPLRGPGFHACFQLIHSLRMAERHHVMRTAQRVDAITVLAGADLYEQMVDFGSRNHLWLFSRDNATLTVPGMYAQIALARHPGPDYPRWDYTAAIGTLITGTALRETPATPA